MSLIVEKYNQIAEQFCRRTVSDNRSGVRGIFSKYLKKSAIILDAGCGSGRDTKAFLDEGFNVEAIDGSEGMARFATKYIGRPVQCLLFEEMNFTKKFDGIWASASLVHHDLQALYEVFPKFISALKASGYWCFSLKHGVGVENIKDNLNFHLHDEISLKHFLSRFPELEIKEMWVKKGYVGEAMKPADWIYCIVRKL